jgi:hypothetical protein
MFQRTLASGASWRSRSRPQLARWQPQWRAGDGMVTVEVTMFDL